MNNKNNTVVELSIDLLSQISGGVAETLPELSSLIVYPELYPYLPLFPLPAPSPVPDSIFWPNMPFVYPL